jgi:5-methylcytosine-specific restriction endonuclease McrA
MHQKGKPSLRLLADIYKNTCQICLRKFPTKELTIEHVYPKSKGGPHEEWNVLPTCKECNTLKADIHPYFDVNGDDLDKKIKKIPSFFVPNSAGFREEWEKFIFTKKV